MSTNLSEVPFEAWVDRIFDRPITYPEWYFRMEMEDGEINVWAGGAPDVVLEYLTRLFENPEIELRAYSDRQISQGLHFLASSACSSFMFALSNEQAPWPLRRRCVESLYSLYARLFAPRCAPLLSHLERAQNDPLREEEAQLFRRMNEAYERHMPGPHVEEVPREVMSQCMRSWLDEHAPLQEELDRIQAAAVPWRPYPLNTVCYMWWDDLPFVGSPNDPSRQPFDSAILDVMERTLAINSPACQESALHGLGHWHGFYPERVQRIVDDFIARAEPIDALLSYARAARSGCVQ